MYSEDAIARFESKIERIPFSTCWWWMGWTNTDGYGQMRVDGGSPSAHRISYEISIGPIQDGLEIDHLCRNRSCVNPAHLEPVTHRENVRRGMAGIWLSMKTECPVGHPYNEENTRLKRGSRVCLTCTRKRDREHKQRKRGMSSAV